MNHRVKERVRLPSGRLGVILRVRKSGALAVRCDDGEDLNIAPHLALQVDPKAFPPPDFNLVEVAEERALLERELADIRRAIRAGRVELRNLGAKRRDLIIRYNACRKRATQIRADEKAALARRRLLRRQFDAQRAEHTLVSRGT